ncbi:sporulation protein YqfD [Scopulibacillus cellulosilyticus]|uniref:Sporulation protein YqfD n=1 Tax=Scopulibacillus cellulosilyticus TaxID=2665665 RepID=A0ABW2PYG4_9BACL
MKKNWNETVYGHVKVSISGRLTEQFINRCVREQISIWDIKRIDKTTITCYILLSDIKKIKPVLKTTDCRIHFIDRVGLPFLYKKLMSRLGIISGFVLFFAALFFLSNIVWRIDINGADPKLESEIKTILNKMDVHVGAFEFFLPSTEKIESELSGRLKKVTWLGVSRDGTTYHIDLVQKELPKKEKVFGPRHLVATKKAIVHKIFAEKGQPMVEQDQFVKPGQILISGLIGKESAPKPTAAKGKVIGETWYLSKTTVPLQSRYKTYTGETYTKRQLQLFGWNCPLWGLKNKPFKHYDREVTRKPVHFLFWDLPIAYKRITYRESEDNDRKLTETQALQEGKQAAYKKLKSQLPLKSKIVSQNIDKKEINNGKMKLTIHYIVYENIAKAEAIDPAKVKEQIEKEKKKKKDGQE